MSNQIVEHGQGNLPVATPATPADLLLYAMQKGGNIEQVEKLMELQMRWEADQARKAYVADMAEFKKNPPKIVKDKLVEHSGISYKHATLGGVTGAIVEGLAAYGFSHRWDTEQLEGGLIVVTCVLTHKLGHSERTTLKSGRDDSGKKNNIQAMASAITYLQRYTLLAACGLATNDQNDDDGSSAEEGELSELAKKWIGDANVCKDLQALEGIWKLGIDAINQAGSDDDYQAFKEAVNARKAVLGARANGRPSRVADIVGRSRQPNEKSGAE